MATLWSTLAVHVAVQLGLEPGLASKAALSADAELAAQLEPKLASVGYEEVLNAFLSEQAGLEPALASEAALQSEARPAADLEPDQAGPTADSHHLLAPDARPNGGTGAAAAAERPHAGPAGGDSSVGKAGPDAPTGAPAPRGVGVLSQSLI